MYTLWLQIDGHVTVTYCLAGRNMSISETLRLAGDGRYHVVRFTRYGANATLQLDDLPTQTRNYSGQFTISLSLSLSLSLSDYQPNAYRPFLHNGCMQGRLATY